MSWHFSIEEKDYDNAVRVFGNKLAQNEATITPERLSELDACARHLAFKVPKGQSIRLECHGRTAVDGTWSVGVTVSTALLPERSPD